VTVAPAVAGGWNPVRRTNPSRARSRRVTSSTQITEGHAYSFTYSYNAAVLESIQYPSGRKVTYDYDDAGRPSTVGLDAVGATDYVSSVSYTPHGAVSSLSLHNEVVETAFYNSRLQPYLLEAVKSGTPSTSLWKLENFYCEGGTSSCTSNNGNVISQKLTAPKREGGSLVLATGYGYDVVNRITSAEEKRDSLSGTRTWLQNYSYITDGSTGQYGNLTQTGDVPYSLLTCHDYRIPDPEHPGNFKPPTNLCTDAGISHDPVGNVTVYGERGLGYDAENRQIVLHDGDCWGYHYDGEGRRGKKTHGANTTVYVYDAMGRLAAEYASVGSTDKPDCTRCYLTADHLGSTRLVTDAAGAAKRRTDYYPFGWEIGPTYGDRNLVDGYAATDKSNPKFTGKERDYESGLGLDYFGARYFSGAQGRFTSPDPMSAGASVQNPQSWNGCAYALGNPLVYIDPNGKWPFYIHNRILTGAFGGVLSRSQVRLLQKVSWDADFAPGNQDPSNAYRHSMCGSGQGAAGCSLMIGGFIDQQMSAAKRLSNGGKTMTREALVAFGEATHAPVDMGDPSHFAGGPWPGEMGWAKASHICGQNGARWWIGPG
jgi:RHS repeat-associated protein